MFKSRGTKSTASASRVVLVRCLYRRLFRDYYAGINVHLSGEMTQIDQAMSRDELIAVFGREVLLPESTEPLLNLARANVTVELGRRGGVKRVLIPNVSPRYVISSALLTRCTRLDTSPVFSCSIHLQSDHFRIINSASTTTATRQISSIRQQ